MSAHVGSSKNLQDLKDAQNKSDHSFLVYEMHRLPRSVQVYCEEVVPIEQSTPVRLCSTSNRDHIIVPETTRPTFDQLFFAASNPPGGLRRFQTSPLRKKIRSQIAPHEALQPIAMQVDF